MWRTFFIELTFSFLSNKWSFLSVTLFFSWSLWLFTSLKQKQILNEIFFLALYLLHVAMMLFWRKNWDQSWVRLFWIIPFLIIILLLHGSLMEMLQDCCSEWKIVNGSLLTAPVTSLFFSMLEFHVFFFWNRIIMSHF